MDGHQIPTAPEDITPEWLARSLLSANTISSAAVASIDINETGDVKGSTGPMARLYLTYDEDAQEEIVPRSLIVKCQHRDSKIRAAFRPGRIYEREVRFYKELAHEAEIGTPKLYYGEVDKESNKYILLLEDLAPARVGDNVAGCSLDEAELAMRQLAGLHASFWESSRLRELSWMPSSSDISAYHLGML